MKRINPELLIKKIHFPSMEPLPAKGIKANIFKRGFKFLTNKRCFMINKEHCMWCEYLKAYIYTPFNFIYDGASVPKLLNFIYSTIGILFYGACSHDLGYRYGGLFLVYEETPELIFVKFTKSELDTIFKELSAEESGMRKACATAAGVLKVAGIPTWNTWRKENKKPQDDFPELFEIDNNNFEEENC